MVNLAGFDASQVEPITTFDPIPAGKYLAMITASEMKPNKAGTGSYLELVFTIIEEKFKNCSLWARLNIVQNISSPGRSVEARSAGCLCRLVPLYGTMRPVERGHAFILGSLGRRSDTLYTVPIPGRRCILPDGTEVQA